MKSIIQIPRIPLFTEIEEPQSYAIYIFGTDNRLLQDADTFGDALARYLNEYNISQDMFARMTGITAFKMYVVTYNLSICYSKEEIRKAIIADYHLLLLSGTQLSPPF